MLDFERIARRLVAPSVLAFATLIAAACGGAAPSASSPAASGPGGSPATATAEATRPASADPSAPAESPGVDLSDAAAAVEDLTGYQLDAVVTSTTAGPSGTSGTVTLRAIVDRENDAFEFTMGGMADMPGELKVIVVGDDAWLDVGAGGYLHQPGGAAQFGSTFDAYAPETLLESIPPAALRFLERVGEEQKNGVATVHYRMDGSNPEIAEHLGAGAEVEFWVAVDGGYLVSMRVVGEVETEGETAPLDMTMDISRINDPTIDVQPPS